MSGNSLTGWAMSQVALTNYIFFSIAAKQHAGKDLCNTMLPNINLILGMLFSTLRCEIQLSALFVKLWYSQQGVQNSGIIGSHTCMHTHRHMLYYGKEVYRHYSNRTVDPI